MTSIRRIDRRGVMTTLSCAGFVAFASLAAGCDNGAATDSAPSVAVAAVSASGGSSAASAGAASATELSRIQAFLDARYTSQDVRYSFHTKFHETIDCIDFFAQPGAKKLAARGQTLTQLPVVAPPSSPPHVPQVLADVAFNGQPDDQGNPRSCPSGSVPMVRITPDRILKAGGLDMYLAGRAKHRGRLPNTNPDQSGAAPTLNDSPRYSWATTNYTGPGPIVVGEATLSIVAPFVQGGATPALGAYDHSLGQSWMISSDGEQTVETGYIVSPGVNFGDQTDAYLFVFSTTDDYASGCYNNDPDVFGLTCDGPFIETPGAAYAPGMMLTASPFDGSYDAIDFYTYFGSTGSGNGWIVWNVGYYPASNFWGTMASGTAGQYQAGFEVDDHAGYGVLPMGTGAASNASFGQAAYVQFMEAESSGGSWSASFSTLSSTAPAYTVYTGDSGYYFVGDQTRTWWGHDYGTDFSPVGDYAPGYYKGECLNGHAVIGDSCFTNAIQSHAVNCGQQTLVTYTNGQTGSGCYPRNITNGDNRGYDDGGWDWQVGYIKDECGANEYVQGLSQGSNGYVHGLLCCPGNVTHSSCNVQVFFSSNSDAYGSGPDTDPGYNKGVCPNGQYVAGVSQDIPSGGVYSLLCCTP